jgi:hypothetical protein
MVTTNFIGTQPKAYPSEPPKGTTWATVRAPVFKGDGFYIDNSTFPLIVYSESWAKNKDAGYPYALTEIRKAYPYKDTGTPGVWDSYTGNASTAIGCNSVYQEGGGYIYYLTLGMGQRIPTTADSSLVFNGYRSGAIGFPEERTGYDHESTKSRMLGGTVNLTYYSWDGVPVTTDVTITEDLFPADLFPSDTQQARVGVFIASIPPPPEFPIPNVRPEPWWTINSVTLP